MAGSYDIEVVALAKAHQLASTAYPAGSTTAIGTGTLTINSGFAGFSVTLDPAHNTLADIRDAINNAPGNNAVQATLVNEVNGTHLVLTARNTGEASAIRVTTTGGDGGLSQLVYDPLNAIENLDEMRRSAGRAHPHRHVRPLRLHQHDLGRDRRRDVRPEEGNRGRRAGPRRHQHRRHARRSSW